MPSDAASDLLRRASLRVTAPRVAVLTELQKHPHADVNLISSRVRGRLGAVSTQAIYDVLRALTDAGLVRRIEPAGSPALFETRTGDNHHHVVCRGCGAVADVECAAGASPCLDARGADGFVIDEAEVFYWGRCPECRASAPEGDRPAQDAAGEQELSIQEPKETS